MHPIVIKGHERPLSQLKYNRDGDVLISTGRDHTVSVWFSENGERLGTLPHEGAVYSVDIDPETRICVTCGTDNEIRFWDLATGRVLHQTQVDVTARFIEFSPDMKQMVVVREHQRGYKGALLIYDIDISNPAAIKTNLKNTFEIEEAGTSATTAFIQASWTFDGKFLIAARKNGTVSKINAATGSLEAENKIHEQPITDLQMSPCRTYFVTSSRDKHARLVNAETLEVMHTYLGDVPLNSAAITPIKNYIIAGGGIDARDVTTSSNGVFESHFFHKLYEDDLGRLGGHFGPINSIVVHPFGTSYASGSEDGYIRIHHFDQSYFDFDYGVPAN